MVSRITGCAGDGGRPFPSSRVADTAAMVSSAPAIPCRSLCWAKEVSPSRVRQSAWATSFPAELLGALARNRRTAPRRPCALSVCETVLGLRSGGGIDVLLYARPVGTSGMAYGVGMTDKMLTPGLPERREAGVINVEFVEGLIEDVLLPDSSVDVVNSNCVINLSINKAAVFAETDRVLRPIGRLGGSDIVAENHLDPAQRAERGGYVGAHC